MRKYTVREVASKIDHAVLKPDQAIADDVQEIDIGQFLSGHFGVVRSDIQAVVETAHAAGVKVKVIQESGLPTMGQVVRACEITLEAGADFVKTSTGFAATSATPEIIDVMVKTVGGRMGIKASGGIRTWDQAVGYLEQGATRLGIGATAAVVDGGVAAGIDRLQSAPKAYGLKSKAFEGVSLRCTSSNSPRSA